MKKISTSLLVMIMLLALPTCGQEDRVKAAMKEARPLYNGKRIALVWGNSSYQQGRLRNPANDAEDIAKALRELGFEVTLKIDVRFKSDMVRQLEDFGRQITLNSTALCFYA